MRAIRNTPTLQKSPILASLALLLSVVSACGGYEAAPGPHGTGGNAAKGGSAATGGAAAGGTAGSQGTGGDNSGTGGSSGVGGAGGASTSSATGGSQGTGGDNSGVGGAGGASASGGSGGASGGTGGSSDTADGSDVTDAPVDAYLPDSGTDSTGGSRWNDWKAFLPLASGSANITPDSGSANITPDISGHGYNASYGSNESFSNSAMVMSGSSDVYIPPQDSVPAVDLTGSYSVSVWVTMTDTSAWRTFVSADGAQVSEFYLQKRADNGQFSFTLTNSDSNSAADVPCMASSSTTPAAGTLYHLVATRDGTTGLDTLYVNGVADGSSTCLASDGIGWPATTFGIGYGRYNGANTDFVSGSLSGVGLVGRVLTASEVAALYALGAVDWKARLPLVSGSAGSTPDVSGHGYNASYGSDVSFSDSAMVMSGSGDVSIPPQSLIPAVDLTGSYSVSAWGTMTDTSGYRTFVSADGNQVSEFYLQKRGDTGLFAFTLSTSDSNNGVVAPCMASSSLFPDSGTLYHLVATRDSTTGLDTLYVNGVMAGTATCLASNGVGWAATTLGIGHGMYNAAKTDYVSGSIFGVGLVGRVLTATEVAALYALGGLQ